MISSFTMPWGGSQAPFQYMADTNAQVKRQRVARDYMAAAGVAASGAGGGQIQPYGEYDGTNYQVNTGTGTGTGTGFGDANAANQARLDAITKGYDDRYKLASGRLEGLGAATQRDIRNRYDGLRSGIRQDMTNRGLANSTLPAAADMGLEQQKSQDMQRAAESTAQQQVDVDRWGLGDKLGMLERVNDEFPDLNFLAELAARAGYGPGGNIRTVGGGYR